MVTARLFADCPGNIEKICAKIRKSILVMAAFLMTCPVWACMPMKQADESGFVRSNVTHLPMNARGVIFMLMKGAPRAKDFKVTSAEDTRRLTVRVRAFEGSPWVRVEPVSGFQADARYKFRYLGKHGDWTNPDEMIVTIDRVEASSSGNYALSLAARPAYKVIVVPTSSGSCVEPSPAAVQEFTYTLPPSMERYRGSLEYGADVVHASKARFRILALSDIPSLYDNGSYSLGRGFSKQYDTRNNAVVASCGARRRLVHLDGFVRFPELDMTVHRTPRVEVDLNRNMEGSCDQLEALLHTVNRQVPESSLRELCHGGIASTFTMAKQPLRAVPIEEWELELSNLYRMAPTCNLVALAYLWHNSQYDATPETLRRIGEALRAGLHDAGQVETDAALHALAYVVEEFPRNARHTMAHHLLTPIQPALVNALAEPHQKRAGEIAWLIKLGSGLM